MDASMTVGPQLERRKPFPFNQELSTNAVLKLLSGQYMLADYTLYLRTPHWTAKRAEVLLRPPLLRPV